MFKFLKNCCRIKDVHNKAVVISGCDSGFGRELSLRLLRHGFGVYSGCYSSEGQESLKKEAGEHASRLHTFELNVRSDESVAKARKYVEENLGNYKFHGLVNNAGIGGAYFPATATPIEVYTEVMDTNFFSMCRMTNQFSPLLKRDGGRVINMASVNGKIAIPFTAPYCASKCAVNGYSDILRREMQYFGVKVIVLEPSFYKTPLMNLKPLEDKIDKLYAECAAEEKKFYGPDFVKYLKDSLKETDKVFSSTKTHQVVDAYFDALTSVCPKPRYAVGFYAKALFRPGGILNTRAQDLLFRLLSAASPQPPKRIK